jgi:two-component system sensor histidine kinase BaeS
MADSLETQETLRRNLMADVAHELRTPLSGIQGTVEAMQDGVFPVTTENLGVIHEQVLWLNHLVEDLRTLANAEAGQLSLERLAVDLAQLCARRIAAFQPQAAAKSITLTLHMDDAPSIVCGDVQRLGQVLSNLLDNALRHTPAGGEIRVQLAPINTEARLTVMDNGEGIDPAALAHVFDRFYRADGSRTRRSGGSGLGLAIARQLVEAHHGSIAVMSPPPGQPQGSAFTVKLPLL